MPDDNATESLNNFLSEPPAPEERKKNWRDYQTPLGKFHRAESEKTPIPVPSTIVPIPSQKLLTAYRELRGLWDNYWCRLAEEAIDAEQAEKRKGAADAV